MSTAFAQTSVNLPPPPTPTPLVIQPDPPMDDLLSPTPAKSATSAFIFSQWAGTIIAVAAAMVVAVFLISNWCGQFWLAELFSHFRVQQLIVLSVLTLGLLVCRFFRTAAVAVAFCLWIGAPIALSFVGPTKIALADRTTCSILSANVLFYNNQTERFLELVRDVDPDIILVVECTDEWEAALSVLREEYPHTLASARKHGFGIACFSRFPLIEPTIIQLDSRADAPAVSARIQWGGGEFHLFGVHLLSPLDPLRFEVRNGQLRELATVVNSTSGPRLVAGDFNATPWSPHMREFFRQTRLHDSRKGFGVQASWPQSMPWIRIPIDLLLASSEIEIVSRRIERDIGSDHYPILTEIAIPGVQ